MKIVYDFEFSYNKDIIIGKKWVTVYFSHKIKILIYFRLIFFVDNTKFN